MPVHFSANPSSTPPVDLSPLLMPQLRSRHGSQDARSALLRVLVRGLGTGVAPQAVRYWCRVHSAPEVLRLVNSNSVWNSLLTVARDHLTDRAPSLSAARRLVGRLVTEIPVGAVSKRTEANARIALAIMTLRMIEMNASKVLCTSTWLGTEMNLQPLAAGRLLRAMEHDLKFIRRVGSRAGGLFFSLTKLDEDTAAWASLHEATVTALVERDYRHNRLALAISTAAHPAWHYGVDHLDSGRTWLRLVLSMSGQPKGVGLGLGPSAMRTLAREADAQLPGSLDGEIDLELALDVIADLSLATERKEECARHLTIEATANRVRVLAFRESQSVKYELRKSAGVLLRAGLRHVGAMPTGTDLPAVVALVGELATWFNRDAPIEDLTMFAPIAEMLAERMIMAGWPATLVDRAVRHVFRGPI